MIPDHSAIAFLVDRQRAGLQTALVTVTDVTGASVRNPGAHMAVDANGGFVGSFSGGCIEAAVVAEAIAAIKEGCVRQIKFGAGSPYIDIRLPCGGSVDLLITPAGHDDWPEQLLTRLRKRMPTHMLLPADNSPIRLMNGDDQFRAGWTEHGFAIDHIPLLRLQIIGHGASVLALAELTQAIPAELAILTPDDAIIAQVQAKGLRCAVLKTPDDAQALEQDQWTATSFFFHDHEWEARLMAASLALPGFFIGAMGSRKTHGARCELLQQKGVPNEAINRLVSPIGLFHSSRDPATLALSTLAQIVRAFDNNCIWRARQDSNLLPQD